jgi:hypothetical protein
LTALLEAFDATRIGLRVDVAGEQTPMDTH